MSSPAPIWEVINGFGAYWALHAAVDLGLFDALAAEPRTTPELADALEVGDPADLETLAALLVAVGLLDTDGAVWSLPEASARFLVSASPASMVELVRWSPGAHAAWPKLAQTLRSGGPGADDLAATEELYPRLVAATAPTQRAVAAGVAAELTRLDAWGTEPSVLDLGCGSAAWLTTLVAAAGNGATGLGVDLPGVVSAVAPAVTDPAVALVAGDYLTVALPEEPVQVAVLAHVLRAEPVARAEALVARAVGQLAPSGILAVADYFVPSTGATAADLRAARHDLTLALTMRASTGGRGLTEADLTRWCRAHGAEPIGAIEPVPRQVVHLFRRGGDPAPCDTSVHPFTSQGAPT